MSVIPQKELRNNVGDVLRRAQAGEEMTVTVSGRPVAQIGPLRQRTWIDSSELDDLWALPTDSALVRDLDRFGSALRDPFVTQ